MGTIRPLSPTPHKKFQPRDQEVVAVLLLFVKAAISRPSLFLGAPNGDGG